MNSTYTFRVTHFHTKFVVHKILKSVRKNFLPSSIFLGIVRNARRTKSFFDSLWRSYWGAFQCTQGEPSLIYAQFYHEKSAVVYKAAYRNIYRLGSILKISCRSNMSAVVQLCVWTGERVLVNSGVASLLCFMYGVIGWLGWSKRARTPS